MAYPSDIAGNIAGQLAKLVTLNRLQLAGQVANLDIWEGEARHCLDVIDVDPRRIERIKPAPSRDAACHETVEFLPG